MARGDGAIAFGLDVHQAGIAQKCGKHGDAVGSLSGRLKRGRHVGLDKGDGTADFSIGDTFSEELVDFLLDCGLELLSGSLRSRGYIDHENIASFGQVERERRCISGNLPLANERPVQAAAAPHSKDRTAYTRRVILSTSKNRR